MPDAGNKIRKGIRISGRTKLGQVRLRESLVVPSQFGWKPNELHRAAAMKIQHHLCQVRKTPALSGSYIVDPAFLRMFEEPEINLDGIVDMDEITPERFTTLKKPDFSGRQKLLIEVQYNTGHFPFMLLAGAIDIEIAKADDWRVCIGQDAANHLIEQDLGIGVEVQGGFVFSDFLAG